MFRHVFSAVRSNLPRVARHVPSHGRGQKAVRNEAWNSLELPLQGNSLFPPIRIIAITAGAVLLANREKGAERSVSSVGRVSGRLSPQSWTRLCETSAIGFAIEIPVANVRPNLSTHEGAASRYHVPRERQFSRIRSTRQHP